MIVHQRFSTLYFVAILYRKGVNRLFIDLTRDVYCIFCHVPVTTVSLYDEQFSMMYHVKLEYIFAPLHFDSFPGGEASRGIPSATNTSFTKIS